MSLASFLRFSFLVDQLARPSRWSEERLKRIQQRRLGRLLELAAERSPFHRAKLRGLAPRTAKLTEVPPTTKAEIREHFDDALTDRTLSREEIEEFLSNRNNLGKWLRGKYSVSRTSGSQGPPLLIVQDRACLERALAIMSARSSPVNRRGPIERVRRWARPRRVAIVSLRRGFHPSGAATEFLPGIVGPHARVERFSSMRPDLIERLNRFQPNVLVGYASLLEGLALRRERLCLNSLWQISNANEMLTARARRRIELAFEVPVIDHYGMGECWLLSDGCPAGGLHVNADWAILEVVDDDYRPVPLGELGTRVLITNLANHVQPFIRYDVPDRVALAIERCPCGSSLPLIKQIEGRSAERFWVGGEHDDCIVSGVLFHAVIDSMGFVREWQAVQTSPNEIELRLMLMDQAPFSEQFLERLVHGALHDRGLPRGVSVVVRKVERLLPDVATGRMRRMVKLVGQRGE